MDLDDAKEREAEVLDGATPEQMLKRAHFTKSDSDTVSYPPQSTAGFPGVSEVVHGFGHLNLDPDNRSDEYQMDWPAIHFIQRPPGHGHVPGPHPFSTSSKPPIGYAGYIFTKKPAECTGEKETWAIVKREQMPASQADLESQVEKSCCKRGVTGLDQYMDSEMKSFQRKQIDELIRDCVKLAPDPRFEYIVASIKRDTKRRQSGPETSTMQVILKRQPRAGIDMRGAPFIGFGSIRLPSGGFINLSEVEDSSSMICNPDSDPIFAEEVAAAKNSEDLPIVKRFEEMVRLNTSKVHGVRDDVRSPFGNVFVGHDAAPSPMKLNAPHFSIGRTLSPQVVESHNDQSDVHVIDFGQPSPGVDGSQHDHPIFDEEGHDMKEELSGAQHHEETNDLKPLSSNKNTESIDIKPASRRFKPLSRMFHHVRDEPEYYYNWIDDTISLSTLSCQSSLVSAARSYSKSRYYPDSPYYR